MTTLAEEVTRVTINGLLLARAPEILDQPQEGEPDVFGDAVRGAAVEVIPISGPDPAPGPVRDLAVRCIAYGAASEIEAALFPEQQSLGDQSRAEYLRRRFDEIRGQLQDLIQSGSEIGVAASMAPAGGFPDPLSYPDPAEWRRRCW